MPVHDLDALEKEAKESARETIMGFTPTFYEFTDAVVLTDETTYTETDWYARGAWERRTSVSDAPDSETIESVASSTEPLPYQNLMSMSFDEYDRNPMLVRSYAMQLAQGWLDDLDDDWWTAVLSAAAAVHPENGGAVYAAKGGGVVYYMDAFTITPPGGVAFDQATLFSDTLSDTAFSSGLAARHNYLLPNGRRANRPQLKPRVWCVAALETQMKNLLLRQGEIYDGTGLQYGAFGSSVAGPPVITPAGITDSTTAWGFIWSRNVVRKDQHTGKAKTMRACPIVPVVRDNLRIRVTEDTNDNVINVIGHGSKAVHYRPFEGDMQLHIS